MLALAKPLAYLAIVLALIGGVWFYGHERYNAGTLDCQARYDFQSENLRQKQQKKIEQIDWAHQKELADAQAETDRLMAALGNGTQRLYVRAKCPARSDTAPTSLDHATETAELDPTLARSIVSITTEGDAAIRQLGACQAYIKAIRGE